MSFNGRVGPLIVRDGLVGCWDAASKHSYPGSGTTWKDISGEGNDATESNTPTFINQYGGYWHFNGTNEFFSYDTPAAFHNKYLQDIDITVEVWASLESFGGCCAALWSFGQYQFQIAPDASYASGGKMSNYVYSGAWLTSTGSITNLKQWYCYVTTHSTSAATTYNLYVDGNFNSSDTTSNNPQFTYGTNAFGTNNYNSPTVYPLSIAVVRMYDRVLTASEIKENYVAQRGRFTI